MKEGADGEDGEVGWERSWSCMPVFLPPSALLTAQPKSSDAGDSEDGGPLSIT